MKAVPLALCLAACVYVEAIANESRHAVIVDMPKVITLSHASPDTWQTLAPIQRNGRSTASPAFGPTSVFGQGFVEPKCGPQPTLAGHSSSLVEF
jgi:hypothetical protein